MDESKKACKLHAGQRTGKTFCMDKRTYVSRLDAGLRGKECIQASVTALFQGFSANFMKKKSKHRQAGL